MRAAGLLTSLLVLFGGASPGARAGGQVQTVPRVDLDRYYGSWFEIARYPNRFQKSCASDVVAEYAPRPDGRIQVVNRCRRADGTTSQASGVARLATRDGSNARLEVRFAPAFLSFIPAVWGDYWIIGLADDYSYAVVGDPGRSYLWILSRTPELAGPVYSRLLDLVRSQGFDPSRLVRTKQSRPAGR
jgi:apolipoprotein D and lipocalin family protein